MQPLASFYIEIHLEMSTLITEKVILQQVFANLIGNVIKQHTRADGCVKISIRDLGKYSEFTVSDDGSDIRVEYHNSILAILPTLEALGYAPPLAIGKKTRAWDWRSSKKLSQHKEVQLLSSQYRDQKVHLMLLGLSELLIKSAQAYGTP